MRRGEVWENAAMTSWRLAAAWLLALAVTTALTWQIVSAADSQVGATPAEIVATPSTSVGATPTSLDTTPTTSQAATTSTSSGPSTTSSSGSPTTSAPPQETASWSVRTVSTAGGAVVLRYRPNEVELQAATPLPGFEVEVDDPGPERVRVEFESEDTDVRVEAKWDDGSLEVDVTGGT